ncbi:MAG: DUF4266 domain-containing protein [Nitrospirae bacterium]|nr:DUF4266 domain-containing protein [Nitrospirota bacterium]MBI5097265.1 DUF4266 domain-containing protein [Nitrospirota bacterium]
MKTIFRVSVIFLIVAIFSGCAAVKPWEREYLSDPIMQLDANKEEKAVKEHFLGTREGSTGSLGVSGGGCGCN